MNRVVVTIANLSAFTQTKPGKNCNKMQNEDQIGTYVRQMTDDP